MPSNFLKSLGLVLEQAGRSMASRWRKSLGSQADWRARGEATREGSYLAGLRSATASERWRAAAGLGRNPLRSPEAIAALVHALGDDEQFVRWHAAEALAQQEQGRVFEPLKHALQDANPLRRASAAEALGKLGGEAAALTLAKQAGDPDAGVRQAVAGALAVLADPTSGPALLPLLNDESSDVVTEAARALGRIGNPSSATFLAATLAKPGQPLLARRALAAALAHAGHPDAQPQLLAALEDEDPQVRAYAADALGHIGTEQALPALAALKADKNRLIRGVVSDRATRAIELLERRGRREGKTAEGS